MAGWPVIDRRVGRFSIVTGCNLEVLASYPNGRATVAAMNVDLAILAGADSSWANCLKRLAAVAPDLDIFRHDYSGFSWLAFNSGRA